MPTIDYNPLLAGIYGTTATNSTITDNTTSGTLTVWGPTYYHNQQLQKAYKYELNKWYGINSEPAEEKQQKSKAHQGGPETPLAWLDRRVNEIRVAL